MLPGTRNQFDGFAGPLAQWPVMGDLDLMTAAGIWLMKDLRQRVTAARPELVSGDAPLIEAAAVRDIPGR